MAEPSARIADFPPLSLQDLSSLEPHINGPFTPDLATPLSKFAEAVKKNDWPQELKVGLIGSCTNSSYEDMSRSASIAEEAAAHGLKVKSKFTITPGSEQIRATIARDGQMDILSDAGGVVLANACGPCIGQWDRTDVKKGEKNSIITSYNRNFTGRNDANPATHAFVASPDIVTAMVFAGDLTFNPMTDSLKGADGKEFKFSDPTGKELPPRGYDPGEETFQAPPEDRSQVQVKIDPNSDRLEFLPAWEPYQPGYEKDLYVLVKAEGKCTTDHISAGGPWLKYRGHISNISRNTYSGVISAFTHEANQSYNHNTGKFESTPEVALQYKGQGKRWVFIGGDNVGEGSSREHAALQPRHLGGFAAIAKSFARIHESNLKKQGLVAATFKNPDDYDKILKDDIVTLEGLDKFAPGSELNLAVKHADGSTDNLPLVHSYNEPQLKFFNAGSALNLMAAAAKAKAQS